MSNGARPMTKEDRNQIQTVIDRTGGPNQAAKALGVNVATLARALAGLPVLSISSSYLRLSLPRALEKLPKQEERQG